MRHRYLVASRVVDQAVLGLGSLLLARDLGPEAFAPVALLFVVNSLAIQLSDLGLGFAVLRSPPGRRIATRSLSNTRRSALAIALIGLATGAVVAGDVGVVLATSGAVWLLSAEGYVRKAAALKLDCPSEVARSEIAGAVVFAVGTVIAVALQSDVDVVVVVGLMFGAKHLVELLSVRTWRPMFARDGSLARSGPEWLGQVFTYLTANADYVVLGVMLGAADLSRYVISFRFASAMPALVANPITQGAFVDLAEATEEDHRQTAYDTVVRRALSTGVLAAIGLMAAAPALQAVLGEAWSGTAALIVVLALSVPFRLLLGATIAQAITAGAARQVVMWEFGRLVLVTTAAVVGASFSLMAATAAISVATIVSVTGEHRLAASVSGTRMDRRLVPAAGMAVAAVIVVAVVFSN